MTFEFSNICAHNGVNLAADSGALEYLGAGNWIREMQLLKQCDHLKEIAVCQAIPRLIGSHLTFWVVCWIFLFCFTVHTGVCDICTALNKILVLDLLQKVSNACRKQPDKRPGRIWRSRFSRAVTDGNIGNWQNTRHKLIQNRQCKTTDNSFLAPPKCKFYLLENKNGVKLILTHDFACICRFDTPKNNTVPYINQALSKAQAQP